MCECVYVDCALLTERTEMGLYDVPMFGFGMMFASFHV